MENYVFTGESLQLLAMPVVGLIVIHLDAAVPEVLMEAEAENFELAFVLLKTCQFGVV